MWGVWSKIKPMQGVNKIIIAHLVAAYILPFTNHRKQNKLDYRENIKFGIWLELGGFRLEETQGSKLLLCIILLLNLYINVLTVQKMCFR